MSKKCKSISKNELIDRYIKNICKWHGLWNRVNKCTACYRYCDSDSHAVLNFYMLSAMSLRNAQS